jgi:hypothetical protein
MSGKMDFEKMCLPETVYTVSFAERYGLSPSVPQSINFQIHTSSLAK